MERIPGDGWQEALELYKARREDIEAGRKPRAKLIDGKVVVHDDDKRLTIELAC